MSAKGTLPSVEIINMDAIELIWTLDNDTLSKMNVEMLKIYSERVISIVNQDNIWSKVKKTLTGIIWKINRLLGSYNWSLNWIFSGVEIQLISKEIEVNTVFFHVEYWNQNKTIKLSEALFNSLIKIIDRNGEPFIPSLAEGANYPRLREIFWKKWIKTAKHLWVYIWELHLNIGECGVNQYWLDILSENEKINFYEPWLNISFQCSAWKWKDKMYYGEINKKFIGVSPLEFTILKWMINTYPKAYLHENPKLAEKLLGLFPEWRMVMNNKTCKISLKNQSSQWEKENKLNEASMNEQFGIWKFY
jgi:hypothetical protein